MTYNTDWDNTDEDKYGLLSPVDCLITQMNEKEFETWVKLASEIGDLYTEV